MDGGGMAMGGEHDASARSASPNDQGAAGDALSWGREEHYRFLKALQQYGDARKVMPKNEWVQKIAECVGTRGVEDTTKHIAEYFHVTQRESLMPASLMSMHEQQYNCLPVQIVHPTAIIECAMPLPIQQPPRLRPTAFAKAKAHQNSLLGAYCTAAEWTREEQIVLEEGLKRFPASQYNNLTRYVKIAAFLPDKIITDVAKRYKWMVELQRLNSINFSDDYAAAPELPGSPSESTTLAHSTVDIPTPAALSAAHAGASMAGGGGGGAYKGQGATAQHRARVKQEGRGKKQAGTATGEGALLGLLQENDMLVQAVKHELKSNDLGAMIKSDTGAQGLQRTDMAILEKMIMFRSNLSNALNCLAMSTGCMSKMPPLLVKLHPLPFINHHPTPNKS